MQSQSPIQVKPIEERLIRGEELITMSDSEPAELVRGKIVHRPFNTYQHGYVLTQVAALLYNSIENANFGRVLCGAVGIYTQHNPDTVRAADIVVISSERLQQISPTSYLDIAPELIVEIISLDDTWSEVNEKLAEYFEIGVKLVWVLDPRLKLTHVYRSLEDVSVLRMGDVLTGGDVLPGLEIPLSEIFPQK